MYRSSKYCNIDFVHMPVIRHMINIFSSNMNKIILHQDRKVVLTQKPKKTSLSMNENLIQGDLPIIEYRKRRDYLINKEKNM